MVKSLNFAGLYASLSSFVKKYLSKELFVKFILKTILKNFATGGVKLWLAKKIVGEFYDEIGEPIVNMTLNNIGYKVRKKRNKIVLKRLPKASNAHEYDETINDIFRP